MIDININTNLVVSDSPLLVDTAAEAWALIGVFKTVHPHARKSLGVIESANGKFGVDVFDAKGWAGFLSIKEAA